MTTSDEIVRVEGLAKTFRLARHRGGAIGAVRGLFDTGGVDVHAVRDISFTIKRGETVGYIGPNGAGKSTTIKMLTGILTPSRGTANVEGLIPWKQRKQLARRIGVVFGQRTQLWWDLPLIDSLDLLRHVYHLPEDSFRDRLTMLRELLELDTFITTSVRQLSLGQRMRGDLAAALLHDPSLLYLDEPTIGLDLVAKARVLDFLSTVNREREVTVLLTTHDLNDIERLCRRVVIIDHGSIVFDGTIGQIRERFGTHRTLVVDLGIDADAPLELGIEGVEVTRVDGPRRWLRFNRSLNSASDLISLVANHAPIRDLTIEEPSIEEIIGEIYRDSRLICSAASPEEQ
jgi:ABC-2 type transport system ATP-binding protein